MSDHAPDEFLVIELGGPDLSDLKPSETYADFEIIRHGGPVGLSSARANQILREQDLPLEVVEEPFVAPVAAVEIMPLLVEDRQRERDGKPGAILFNDQKVRLMSDLVPERMLAGEPVRVQTTDYFSTLSTNDITGREVWYEGRRLYDGGSFAIRDNVLMDNDETLCSNHLGACTLGITTDGVLVIPAQALTAAQYAGMMMPSGSGSADLGDLEEAATLQQVALSALERELLEETGLDPFRRAELVQSKLIGYARVLERGGKPDFFGVSLMNVPFHAISSRDRHGLRTDLPKITSDPERLPSLLAALASLREGNRGQVSTSLYLNLLLFEEYLAAEAESFLAWFSSFEADHAGERADALF
jgi:8-oxo-dGTP pyrophosphatase MutT (NUDIX family)